MIKGLEFVKETIDLNIDNIKGNEFETNSYLFDDILDALGYNKKRDTGVRARHGVVNWEIDKAEEKRFIIKVIGYGSDLPGSGGLVSALELCVSLGYKFLVVSDGLKLDIYNTDNKKLLVHIDDIFNDESDTVLNALSSGGWDSKYLLEMGLSGEITADKVREKLFISEVKSALLTALGVTETDKAQDILVDTLNSICISDSQSEIQSNNKSDNQLDSIKAELAERDKELEGLKSQMEENSALIEQLKAQKAEGEAEIDKLKSGVEIKLPENLEKDSVIQSLNSRIDTLRANIADAKHENSRLNNLLSEKKAELANAQAENKKLQDSLSGVEAVIEQSDQSGQSGQAEQSDQSGQSGQAEQSDQTEIQNLKNSLTENESKIQTLQNSLTEKTEQVQTLQNSLNEKTEQVLALQNSLSVKNTEIQNLKKGLSEGGADKDGREHLEHQIELLNNSLNEQTEQVKTLNSSLSTKDTEIQTLNNSLSAKDTEIQNLKNSLTEQTEQVKTLQSSLTEQTEQVKTLNNSLSAKDTEIQNLKNSLSAGNQDGSDNADLMSKLQSLASEKEELKHKLKVAEVEIERLRSLGVKSEGEDVKLARELLNSVEDSNDVKRTYVCAVNGKLYQIQDIKKFVGTCIQELYSAVGQSLMPILFDGGIIKLESTNNSGDMMLGSSQFNIKTDGLVEGEILNKLDYIFSQFEGVVFMRKEIGTLFSDDIDDGFEGLDGLNLGTNNQAEEPEQSLEQVDESTNNTGDAVLVVGFQDIGSILYNSEGITILDPVAIGNDYSTFSVDATSKQSLLDTGIEALLSLCFEYETLEDGSYVPSGSTVYQSLVNLIGNYIPSIAQSNNLLKYCDNAEELTENSIRLLNTNFFLEASSNEQCIWLLVSIATSLGLMDAFIYFNAVYVEGTSFEDNFVTIDLSSHIDWSVVDEITTSKTMDCMIDGRVYFGLSNLKGFESVSEALFDYVVGVGIKEGAYRVDLRTNGGIVKFLRDVLAGLEVGKVDALVAELNHSIDYKRPVLMGMDTPDDELSDKAMVLSLGNHQYKYDTLPASKTAELVMKLFKLCSDLGSGLGIESIFLRIRMNTVRVLYLMENGVNTSNPSEYAAYSGMLESLKSNIKMSDNNS